MDTATFPVALFTTQAPGVVMLRTMRGMEALSELFCYELEVVTSDDVGAKELLGQPITVQVEGPDETYRYFNGIVTEIHLLDIQLRTVLYRLVVRPQVWGLSRNSNCRVFQKTTIKDLVKKVLRDAGYTDFDEKLSGDYPKYDYIVQYNESDFDFISRLMERAGMYYYFTHTKENHKLVLADSPSAHSKGKHCEKLFYYPPDENRSHLEQYVSYWIGAKTIQPGTAASTDYDYSNPRAMLFSNVPHPEPYPLSSAEVFEYPGGFLTAADGNAHCKIRLEQIKVPHDQATGKTNATLLAAGNYFELTGHPTGDGEYLVISTQFRIRAHMLATTSTPSDEPMYQCTFHALSKTRTYRPPLRTPKPRIMGLQTAVVVGKSGDEITCDDGRVKIQFHWDRYGKKNEESSLWVRVAHAWAGSKWGCYHIPRIGHEVVVDFLEGDPDQPIIIGSVYNGDNKIPYDKPTQSGVKSQSTPMGSPNNYNELKFEDQKGKEEFHMQAERNMSTLVKKNRSASIGANDSVSVGGDRSVSVSGNLSVSVSGGGKSPIHSTHSVTGKHKLDATDCIDITAPNYIKLDCSGTFIELKPGVITLSSTGGATVVLTANVSATAKGGGHLELDENVFAVAKGGGQFLIDANVNAQSKGGSALILDGNATLGTKGDVSVQGAKVAIKGDGGVEVSGATVKLNS